MTGAVVYYVSGHGYGHAIRAAEVLRRLVEFRAPHSIHVRTAAPPAIFAGRCPGVKVHRAALDSLIVEEDRSLRINPLATLEHLREFLAGRSRIVSREVSFLRRQNASLVVSDIPFLAGEIARAAGLPCLGIANFTWDWAFEPYFQAWPRFSPLQAAIREGYARMRLLLQLPFGHSERLEMFPEVRRVPLIARRSSLPAAEILRRIGIGPGEEPPLRVLVPMRASLPQSTWENVVARCRGCFFLHFDSAANLPASRGRFVRLGPKLSFPDVLKVSDVVVSKLGYGILADCVANAKPILYPPRVNFREDEILEPGARRYLPALRIRAADFWAGRWARPLRRLREMPQTAEKLDDSGG